MITLKSLQSIASPVLPHRLRKGLLLGVLVALGLVITGRLLTPAMSLLSTIAGLAVLLVYGLLAVLCPVALNKREPDILRLGALFGLASGVIFGTEILLEYIFTPANNSVYGMLEFGAVFILYFVSGFICSLRSLSLKNSVLTSVTAASIASLIWVIFALGALYAFRGSARQTLVLRAEGNYDDFARSGMTDFNVFIMEDFMGATFFHLLLGPTVAAVLGLLGGVFGKFISTARKWGQASTL